MAPNGVKDNAQNDSATVYDAWVVHVHWVYRDWWWEESEDHGDQRVYCSDDVDGHAKSSKVPWAKADGLRLAAAVNHANDGEEIGWEVAGNDERDDGVEGDGWTDVDKTEESVDGTG